MSKSILKITALALSAVMLVSCSPNKEEIPTLSQGPEKETVSTIGQAALTRDELYDRLVQLSADTMQSRMRKKEGAVYEEAADGSKAMTNEALSSDVTADISSGAPDSKDYSKTNNQTNGVDEGDIIKTDGKYIYYVNGADNTVLISSVEDDNAKYLSQISFSHEGKISDSISEIYIVDNYLLVILNRYEQEDNPGFEDDYICYDRLYYSRKNEKSVCKIYDITDRKNPKELKEHEQEGCYNTSRVNDGVLYIVSTVYKDLTDKANFLPKIEGNEIDAGKVLIPDSIQYNSLTYTVISSIKTDATLENKGNAAVCGDWPNIYMSNGALYIITSYENREIICDNIDEIRKYCNDYIKKRYDEFDLTEDELEDYFRECEKYITAELKDNEQEKVDKYEIDALEENYPELKGKTFKKTVDSKIVTQSRNSRIDKYSLAGGKLVHVGQGKTDGTIENNLCLDEKDGYLRMFSCGDKETIVYNYCTYYADGKEIITDYDYVDYVDSQDDMNRVSVFDANMNRVAFIDGIAKDEEIYAARFIGNYGYLVTFEQTDPLFTVDFTDPVNPKVIGELVMPGYSDNLFSFGKDRLFGIGELDNEIKLEMYNIQGNQASILATKLIGYGYTEASYDYKDILVEYDKNLVGFSMYSWDDNNESSNQFRLFKYTGDSFEEIAKIKLKEPEYTADYYYYYGYSQARAVYVGDYIYICYGRTIYWLNYKNADGVVNSISF